MQTEETGSRHRAIIRVVLCLLLITRCFMKRKYRLRRNADFQRVRQAGQSYASQLIVLAFLQNQCHHSRFGFVVSKKLGKAVKRNKIKRRLREAIRIQIPSIKPGFDVVFIARQPITQATFQEINRSTKNLLKAANLTQPSSQSNL